MDKDIRQIKKGIDNLSKLPSKLMVAKARRFKEEFEDTHEHHLAALAYCAEVIRRVKGFTLRDTQLMALLSLENDNTIIDMKTGEGKTLVALTSAYLNALKHGSVHVATVNPYLSRRDFDEAKVILKPLGVSCGLIDTKKKGIKKEAYKQDIVYGTMENFVFDHLFDELVDDLDKKIVPDKKSTLIVDEADLVLLDNAKTPFVVSSFLDSERSLKKDSEIKKETEEISKINLDLQETFDKVAFQMYKEEQKYKDIVFECRSEEDFEYVTKGVIKNFAIDERLLGDDRKNILNNHLLITYNGRFHLTEMGYDALGFFFNNLEMKKILQEQGILEDLSRREYSDDFLTLRGYLKGLDLVGLSERSKIDEKVANLINENMHFLNNSLKAYFALEYNRDYLLAGDKEKSVELILNGRVEKGRSYSEGLALAVELKEKSLRYLKPRFDEDYDVKLHTALPMSYSMPLKSYLQTYENILGMTGTSNAQAFESIYGLDTKEIIKESVYQQSGEERIDYPSRYCINEEAKYKAILEEVINARKTGRPLLISTVDVKESERLYSYLNHFNIPNVSLLNANTKKEADIIALAGLSNSITIATDMAGRGVDIKLDDRARENGGLKIVGMGHFNYKRSDEQVKGRAGRGSDPGESVFYYSPTDLKRMGIYLKKKDLELLERRHPDEEVFEDNVLNEIVHKNQQTRENSLTTSIKENTFEYDIIQGLKNEYQKERDMFLRLSQKDLEREIFNNIYSYYPEDYEEKVLDFFSNDFSHSEMKNKMTLIYDMAWNEFYELSKDVMKTAGIIDFKSYDEKRRYLMEECVKLYNKVFNQAIIDIIKDMIEANEQKLERTGGKNINV